MGELYEMNFKTGRLEPIETESKNNLPIGTVLQLEGYDCPKYVIFKNLGTSESFSCYGSRYQVINIETLDFSQKEASSLMFLKDKKDGRIQTYITDEIMPEGELVILGIRAVDKQNKENEKERLEEIATKERLERGKVLFEQAKPKDAKAVIIAEREIDDCDSMTDYYNTTSEPFYIIGWSNHTKDLFSEMRKAVDASGMPEIAHLGTGKGVFSVNVLIGKDFVSNGSVYYHGGPSHWHDKTEKTFLTRAEAEKYIAEAETLHPVSFDGDLIDFYYDISEAKTEHREKYSMGAGYYLKAANRYSTGWKVEKMKFYNNNALYLAFADGRVKIGNAKQPKAENPQVVGAVTVRKNEEKNGIEVLFPSKPDAEILTVLKGAGFRWSRFAKLWYHTFTPERFAWTTGLLN